MSEEPKRTIKLYIAEVKDFVAKDEDGNLGREDEVPVQEYVEEEDLPDGRYQVSLLIEKLRAV